MWVWKGGEGQQSPTEPQGVSAAGKGSAVLPKGVQERACRNFTRLCSSQNKEVSRSQPTLRDPSKESLHGPTHLPIVLQGGGSQLPSHLKPPTPTRLDRFQGDMDTGQGKLRPLHWAPLGWEDRWLEERAARPRGEWQERPS